MACSSKIRPDVLYSLHDTTLCNSGYCNGLQFILYVASISCFTHSAIVPFHYWLQQRQMLRASPRQGRPLLRHLGHPPSLYPSPLEGNWQLGWRYTYLRAILLGMSWNEKGEWLCGDGLLLHGL